MKKEKGLWLDGNTFVSDEEIRRKLANKQTRVEFSKQLKKARELKDYSSIAIARSQQAEELSPRESNHFSLGVAANALINFIGDWHIGHPKTDYHRIEDEVSIIANTPDSYVALLGDAVDGIHWGGSAQGEDILNLTEQRGFLKSIWRALGGKILFTVSGEHDSKWASKTGADPYAEFTEQTGAPYVRGVAEVDITSGEETYKVVAAHKARGHSMYNKTHPGMRQARFGVQGADIYASGHTHQKGSSQEEIRDFGGESREVTHINVGPYTSGGEFAEREGFPTQTKEQQGGIVARLLKRGEKKHVEVVTDIAEANTEQITRAGFIRKDLWKGKNDS